MPFRAELTESKIQAHEKATALSKLGERVALAEHALGLLDDETTGKKSQFTEIRELMRQKLLEVHERLDDFDGRT